VPYFVAIAAESRVLRIPRPVHRKNDSISRCWGRAGYGVPTPVDGRDEPWMRWPAWRSGRAQRREVGARLLLRLALVMPRAQPLQIGDIVIVSALDMVAVSARLDAPCSIAHDTFALTACALSDEGSTQLPVIGKT